MTFADRVAPDQSTLADAITVVSVQTDIRCALQDLQQSPLDEDIADRVTELLGEPATQAREAFERLMTDQPNVHTVSAGIDHRSPAAGSPRLRVVTLPEVEPSGEAVQS